MRTRSRQIFVFISSKKFEKILMKNTCFLSQEHCFRMMKSHITYVASVSLSFWAAEEPLINLKKHTTGFSDISELLSVAILPVVLLYMLLRESRLIRKSCSGNSCSGFRSVRSNDKLKKIMKCKFDFEIKILIKKKRFNFEITRTWSSGIMWTSLQAPLAHFFRRFHRPSAMG